MHLALFIVAIVSSFLSLVIHYFCWIQLQSRQKFFKYRKTAKKALERILNGSSTSQDIEDFQAAMSSGLLTYPEIESGMLALVRNRNSSIHVITRHQDPKLDSTNPNCKFLSNSQLLRCAVNPTTETCNGCKHFEPKE